MINKFLQTKFSNYSDQALHLLYKQGDKEALSAMIIRYAALINKITSNYKISGIEKDDIKQEAYLGLLNAVRTYDETKNTSFYTYANHCIANKLKNLLISSSTNKAKFNSKFLSLDDIKDYNIPSNEQTINPESILIQKEDYLALINLTGENLSQTENDVLFLFLNGCDYQTIAKKLNSSQKSVDNALQRSRRKLKAVLNEL